MRRVLYDCRTARSSALSSIFAAENWFAMRRVDHTRRPLTRYFCSRTLEDGARFVEIAVTNLCGPGNTVAKGEALVQQGPGEVALTIGRAVPTSSQAPFLFQAPMLGNMAAACPKHIRSSP